MERFEKYFRAVDYVENLPSIHNGCFSPSQKSNPQRYLRRTRWLLDNLSNPDRGMSFIHVTGTSGKGSVAKLVTEMISASNKKTGLFASPFCTTSIEKISIGDKYISPDEFADEVEKLKPIIEKAEKECPWGVPTYFEVFLVTALLYFKKKSCDWVILEVGCGGRYDSSNAIEKKEIAIITNIGLDHTHIIGDTLEKIAHEKAGIIKKGSKFFTNEKKEELLNIFFNQCKKENVNSFEVEKAYRLAKHQKGKMFVREEDGSEEISCSLQGAHQVDNINLAASVAKEIGISKKCIREGIERVNLPCRFEFIQGNPGVVLDGAHNIAKMKTTVSNLKELEYENLILILGVGKKKEAEEIISLIAPEADKVILTTFDFGKPLDVEDLDLMIRKYLGPTAKAYLEKDMSKAMKKALELADKNDLILVTGSFYLAGEIRKKWISERYVLENRSSF